MGWVNIKDTAKIFGISQCTVRDRIKKREHFTQTKIIKNRLYVWLDDHEDSDRTRITTTEAQRAVIYSALSEGVTVTRKMVTEAFNVSDSFVGQIMDGSIKVYKDKKDTSDMRVLFRKGYYLVKSKGISYTEAALQLNISPTTLWNLINSKKEYYKRIRRNE